MVWKTIGEKSEFLTAAERILLGLYLVNGYKSIDWLTGWLGPDYDGKNVYATLSRLVKRQLADRISKGSDPATWTKGSDPLYRITQLGIAWIGRRFPLVVNKGSDLGHGERSDPFDLSLLKAVVIDAAEVRGRRRKLIFDELKRWRYGRLARGVYVTASRAAQTAVAEFVSQYRLGGYVNLMTIQPAENPRVMADRVFRLRERNGRWRLLIDRLNERQRIGGGVSGLRRIREDFLQLLVSESMLPAELLPSEYFMEEAVKRIVLL